nr:GNAT family protein [Nakamurella deserti]
MSAHPVLRSARLELRPLRTDDVPALLAVLRTAEVARWWGPIGDDDVDPDDPDVVQLAIRSSDDPAGSLLGLIQYAEETDPMYRHAGIDLVLDPAVHGRGLGREAIRAVAHHLLDTLGHHRLTIDPSAANERAIRTYTAVGFRPVGVLRHYERDPDGRGWHDGLLMDLLAGELID